MLRALRGHLWTIVPIVKHMAVSVPVPPGHLWTGSVPDPEFGALRLSGIHHRRPGADTVVIVVHGLAGSPDSYYVRRATAAIVRAGCSVLRIALRGADRLGADFYHGGQTADLHAAMADRELSLYRSILILGYSMGGHAALRLAAEPCDLRLRAVAAVCAPLHLASTQRHMDAPRSAIYRRYLLRHMTAMYAAVAARRRESGRHLPLQIPPGEARRIRTFLEWDERIVAVRYGFNGALDYYHRASAAPILDRLRIPALLVEERMDPMLPEHTIRPHLRRASRHLQVRWLDRGGHVGFPPAIQLDMGAPRGLEIQVMDWLLAHTR